MKNYQQQNIYIQNSIRSRHYDFSPIYSEMIGRLCAVESSVTMKDSVEGFAAELLSSFKGTGLYGSVDRICLVMRLGLSNELCALDSQNSSRVAKDNMMKPGYRCFVRPDSTLLNLREGDIRIYDDATRIAETFEKRGNLVQRSLNYVIKMELKSGVCLPLHINGHLRGFLFLNSVEEGLFSKLLDEDYAVLNIVSMIAKLCLLKDSLGDDEYIALKAKDITAFDGAVFDEDELALSLQRVARWQTGELWTPLVRAEGDVSFLYSPATVAYSVIKVVMGLYRSAAEFPKEIVVSNIDDLSIKVLIPVVESAIHPTLGIYKSKVAVIASQLAFLKVEINPGINHVSLKIPFDRLPGSAIDLLYSV